MESCDHCQDVQPFGVASEVSTYFRVHGIGEMPAFAPGHLYTYSGKMIMVGGKGTLSLLPPSIAQACEGPVQCRIL